MFYSVVIAEKTKFNVSLEFLDFSDKSKWKQTNVNGVVNDN